MALSLAAQPVRLAKARMGMRCFMWCSRLLPGCRLEMVRQQPGHPSVKLDLLNRDRVGQARARLDLRGQNLELLAEDFRVLVLEIGVEDLQAEI